MKVRLFQVDAFTKTVLSGNPAAICPLEEWIDTERMQAIAGENNLSETAFFVETDGGYDLRWFTPTTEVDLCGHATLTSAYVVWQHLGEKAPTLRFNTRSGVLKAAQRDGLIVMDFPLIHVEPCTPPQELVDGLGRAPDEVVAYGIRQGHGNYIAVYPAESDVRELHPDARTLVGLGKMGVSTTAPGDTSDFVSRYFAPSFGIDEDPVTGSIHCALTPYWAERLGKSRLHALQVSSHGGDIFCELLEDRVLIAGHAVCYMEASIEI